FFESRSPHPMLPLALFGVRMFAGTNVLTFLLYAALGGTLFFLPLNLIQVQHYSPTAAGAALLPFILIMSVLSRWSGGLVTRYGPRLPLMIGPLVVAIGYLLFILPNAGGNYWTTFFPAVVALGLGMAITVAPLTTAVMNSVPQTRAGVTSGVNNAVARTAGLIAIAILGMVMLHVFKARLDRALEESPVPASVRNSIGAQSNRLAAIEVPQETDSQEAIHRAIGQSFVFGFRAVMLIGAALAVGGSLTGFIFIVSPKRNSGSFSSTNA
ncbi:MAG TPA: MFS transporter, partial [Chthoniobacterales bacterium]|nr:MFS transporter [Chthoniobacterales bacterium]